MDINELLFKFPPFIKKDDTLYYFRIGRGLFGGRIWANYQRDGDNTYLYETTFYPTIEGALNDLLVLLTFDGFVEKD